MSNEKCEDCNGSGRMTGPDPNGSGVIVNQRCDQCNGSGRRPS